MQAATDVDGIHFRFGSSLRTQHADLPALALGVGPGEQVLALAPDGGLYQVAPRRHQIVWEGIDVFSADARLLAAVQNGDRLLMQGAGAGTSIELPGHPWDLASVGASGAHPHLAVLLFSDSAWLLSWSEDDQEIRTSELFHGAAQAAAALEGEPPILAVWEAPQSGVVRLHIWTMRCEGTTMRLEALPLLRADATLPLGLRNGRGGPAALCGAGSWATWRGRWTFRSGSPLSERWLATRIYGTHSAFEPLRPAFDKEPLPQSTKLAVLAARKSSGTSVSRE